MDGYAAANIALELIKAGTLLASKLNERQAQRAAEGRQATVDDVLEVMKDGDVAAATQRAQLATARLAQLQGS